MTAIEFVADAATMKLLPSEINIGERVLDIAYESGLIVYLRRVKGGVQGDCVTVAPPPDHDPRGSLGDCLYPWRLHRHRCA